MVDDNAMALWHQSLWHGDKRDALVDDNDSMTRVMMTGWQAGHYGMVDDKMTTRSLWLMTITLWHKSWWQDDKPITMVDDNDSMTLYGRSLWLMTGWQAGHYGWWQWLHTVTRDNNLPPLPAREDTTQYDTTFTTQRHKQNPNISSGLISSYLPVFSLFVLIVQLHIC